MELDGLPLTVISLAAVTLTSHLLTRKIKQYVSKPRYICDQILVKFVLIVKNTLH